MTGAHEARRVEKPWGYELIWADTELYVGKLLHVNAGHALSLQYHQHKDETLYLLRGVVRLHAGASADALTPVHFEQGATFRVRPGTLHLLEALTDADILEASTPHLEDVVRVDDRYGRA